MLYQTIKLRMENASEEMLLHIARNCGFNDKINSENYQGFIFELNSKILDSCSLEVKHTASHHFFIQPY
jgi:hypothetical protein